MKYMYHVEVNNVEVLITSDWQKALDSWVNTCWENIPKVIIVKKENKVAMYIKDRTDAKNWSKVLIENSNNNRVEKRIMKEMLDQEHDGMETIETKDYETENMNSYNRLNFHGKFENMNNDEQDQIINPKHYKMIPPEAYKRFPEGLEYMHLMEYILKHHNGVESHLLGQIFKYACRLGKKDSKLQDAKKIAWYADRLVKVIENDN